VIFVNDNLVIDVLNIIPLLLLLFQESLQVLESLTVHKENTTRRLKTCLRFCATRYQT